MTLRLFAIFFVFILSSCSDNKINTNLDYDQVINHYKESGVFEQARIKDSKERQAIDNIFKAQQHLENNDSINAVSTSLYLESVDIVTKGTNVALKQWVYSEVGFYYYTYSHYYDAASYFIKISKVIDSDSSVLEIQPTSILMKTAYFFETMKKYDKSIAYYKKVLELTEDQDINNSATLWSLGESNFRTDSLSQAENYFLLASKKALAYKDTLRYAKSLGGLALVYQKKGDKEKAISYFKEDISISRELDEEKNLMYIQIQLGKFYFENKEYDLAEQSWKEAYKVASSKSYLMGFQREIITCLLEVSKIQNRDQEELSYRRELERLDSLIEDKEGDEVIKEINWKASLDRVNWELEIQKNISEKVKYQRLLLLSISSLLFVIIFIIYFFYKRIVKLQARSYQAKLLDFQLEKVNSEKKLTETHASLASYQIYLSEKTKQIDKLERELYRVKNSSNEFLKDKRPALEELLSSHLMTEESWTMFKATFREEQGEYLEYVSIHFPELTESNLRIVLLQKMGLTNLETANLLGVTIDAIKKAKQRLRKKYGEEYTMIFNQE